MPKKSATAAEKRYMGRVAELGCIVCRTKLGINDSPSCVHHVRESYGVGQRAPNTDILPLCSPHHQHGGYGVAYHAGKAIWEANFGTERELQEIMHDLYRETYGEEPLTSLSGT